MNINHISLNSFGANLVRDPKPGEKARVSSTKKEMVKTYDDAIRKIQAQKTAAIEFDTFMHSSDVKKIVNSLPKEDRLIVDAKFYAETQGFGELADRNSMGLTYDSDNPDVNDAFMRLSEEERSEVAGFVDVQNPDGTLNKKGIMDYLKRLKTFIENEV